MKNLIGSQQHDSCLREMTIDEVDCVTGAGATRIAAAAGIALGTVGMGTWCQFPAINASVPVISLVRVGSVGVYKSDAHATSV